MGKCPYGECKNCLIEYETLPIKVLKNIPQKVKIEFVDGVIREGVINYNKDGNIIFQCQGEEDFLCNLMDFVTKISENSHS